MEEPIRVVIGDGDAEERARAAEALTAGGCVVAAEAGTADDAVALVLEHRPDVVLLDVDLPGHGIAAARSVTRRLPGTAVVMFAASSDEDELFDALRAGAVGYLLKDTAPARLGPALRGVLDGEAAIPRRLVRLLADQLRAPAIPAFSRTSSAAAKLSTREWEVMELLAGGLSTDQVARRLFLSQSTVRVHVSAVLRKLRVKDRESAFAVLREE